DGSRATCRYDGLEAAGVRLVDEDARECLIVLDHEENAVIRPDVVPIVVDLLRGRLDMRGGLVHRDRLLFTHPALHVDRGVEPSDGASTRAHVREVELERAPFAGGADDRNLPPEDPGDLAADRQPEPRPAVPAAGAAVGLLEGLEDDLLLLGLDADA